MASPLRVLLVTVLHPRVLLNAAEKQVPVPELQQLAVLLLMEGHDAAAGVDPDAPQVLGGVSLLHKGGSFLFVYYIRRFRGRFCFIFLKNFSKIFPGRSGPRPGSEGRPGVGICRVGVTIVLAVIPAGGAEVRVLRHRLLLRLGQQTVGIVQDAHVLQGVQRLRAVDGDGEVDGPALGVPGASAAVALIGVLPVVGQVIMEVKLAVINAPAVFLVVGQEHGPAEAPGLNVPPDGGLQGVCLLHREVDILALAGLRVIDAGGAAGEAGGNDVVGIRRSDISKEVVLLRIRVRRQGHGQPGGLRLAGDREAVVHGQPEGGLLLHALAQAAQGPLLVDLEDLFQLLVPLHGEMGVEAPVEPAHVPDAGLGEVIPVVGNGGDPGLQGLVFPNGLAVDGELSLVLAVDARQAADQGGFSRAVGAHQAVDASRRNAEAHAVQGGEAAEAFDGVGDLNHRVPSLRPPAGTPPDGSS